MKQIALALSLIYSTFSFADGFDRIGLRIGMKLENTSSIYTKTDGKYSETSSVSEGEMDLVMTVSDSTRNLNNLNIIDWNGLAIDNESAQNEVKDRISFAEVVKKQDKYFLHLVEKVRTTKDQEINIDGEYEMNFVVGSYESYLNNELYIANLTLEGQKTYISDLGRSIQKAVVKSLLSDGNFEGLKAFMDPKNSGFKISTKPLGNKTATVQGAFGILKFNSPAFECGIEMNDQVMQKHMSEEEAVVYQTIFEYIFKNILKNQM